MLSPTALGSTLVQSAHCDVLPTELDFYQAYDWCLNPYFTVSETIDHLREEVEKLSITRTGWQTNEVASNIFLLSSALLNCIEEYLRGPALRLPTRLAATMVGRSAASFVEIVSEKPGLRRQITRWREHWLTSLVDFLSHIIGPVAIEPKSLADAGRKLTRLLESSFPPDLQAQRIGVSTPFSRLDLTQNDFLALGRSFAQRFPDRAQPLLLVGLRSSGSYVAPLLKALFQAEGYQDVAVLTIEPKKGVGRLERRELRRFAAQGYWALILDDPPHTSVTFLAALDIAHRAGFAPRSVKLLAPTHSASPTWFKTFPDHNIVTLLPEQWHKRELLDPKAVEFRLAEYFRGQNFARVSMVASHVVDEFNARLQSVVADERSARLKRIFEVQLETPEGKSETKYVLAKSVGWGWLGYHAFLIGHRLQGYVPPILGLRDGILYMEWIPQQAPGPADSRKELVAASAAYMAARVRHLSLSGSAAGMELKKYNNGARVLQKTLSRAYGRFLTDKLMGARVGQLIRRQPCPSPTLIDGNMRPSEWVVGGPSLLKTDFEHHGMGKTALNVVDPAYDLADTILNLSLSPDEERTLLSQYIAESGDTTVAQRLFMQKLLAGLWAMSRAQDQLLNSSLRGDAQRANHEQFMLAWNFLTVHTARYCGSLCGPPIDVRWRSPLCVLDIDGVIDRRLFGFPCTTAAGIKALSLLRAHDFSVALNTARSVGEVKDYCEAYSLAGGIAEHGSYIWDAVHQRGRILLSAEAIRQLEIMRSHLRNIPGVFLDERHQYSIRAFTYRNKPTGLIQSALSSARASGIGDGALVPISAHIVNQLLEDLQLNQLTSHHTVIDTVVVAKEVDKGTGLAALRDWVLTPDAETIATGDGEHDLAMFRVASRSFAPSNIGTRRQARLYGCRISAQPFQRGLLDIIRTIIHPNHAHCQACDRVEVLATREDDLFIGLLRAADKKWTANLQSAILQRSAYKLFIQ